MPRTALTSGGSSRVSRSSPSPTQPSRHSGAPAQPKAAQKLHLSKPQDLQAEHSKKCKLCFFFYRMSEREITGEITNVFLSLICGNVTCIRVQSCQN